MGEAMHNVEVIAVELHAETRKCVASLVAKGSSMEAAKEHVAR